VYVSQTGRTQKHRQTYTTLGLQRSFLQAQATPNIVTCAHPSQSSSCQYHERESPARVSLFVTLFLASRQSLLRPTVNMKYPFSRRRLRCSRNFSNFNYIWPADKKDNKKIYFLQIRYKWSYYTSKVQERSHQNLSIFQSLKRQIVLQVYIGFKKLAHK
jgi:hypothetical protein